MVARYGVGLLALLAFGADTKALLDKAGEEKWIGNRRQWWAYQAPVRPTVPTGEANPVDAFLRAAQKAKGLAGSPEASKRVLIRRATLDLTGLPPTPEEVAQFLQDTNPGAYERLVERLLASPRYGERWAQRWLDVARYADTNGFELDAERTQAWRYRDYVVQSFNRDKPYDRFLKEQLAGDELYPGDKDAVIATGFHVAGPRHVVGGNTDPEINRQEELIEMTAGVANVFLGMTMNCARCHNHKFDPILQADYYRLQAIFAPAEVEDVAIHTPEEKRQFEDATKAWRARMQPIEDALKAIEKPYSDRLKAEKKAALEPELRSALDVPEKDRTAEQKALAKQAKERISHTWDEMVALLTPEDGAKRAGLRVQKHALDLLEPPPAPAAYAVLNSAKPPVTNILKIGDPHMKLEEVEPGLPTVLAPDNGPMDNAKRRASLANWLARGDHPLTARVMVNRIWQFRFGSGLVGTPNDFGRLGQRPTNAPLLDWLATEFVAQGWSVKAMDRLLVTSRAYRQSAANSAMQPKTDPENKLYWRMNRRRLEGEAIRDSVLLASGAYNPKMGGVPVKVPIEKEVYDTIFTEAEPDNLWPVHPDGAEHNRRSLYLLNKRTVRLPMLQNFDQPDAMSSCAMRSVSTHALQALSMLNSDFMQQQAEVFARRLPPSGAIQAAYEIALGRPPRPVEMAQAREFLSENRLADFCLALVNRNEFVYIP